MNAVSAHKKLIGLFLATITVLTIMSVFIHLSLQDREAYRWVTHTYEVQTHLEATLLDVEAGQNALEDYRLNHDTDAAATFFSAFRKVFDDLDTLEKLVADNPLQTARVRSLRRDISAYRNVLAISAADTAPPVRPAALLVEFRLVETVYRSANGMKQAEQELLEQRIRANRLSQRRANIALACFLVVVGLLIVALFVSVNEELTQQRQTERLLHAADRKVVNVLENISDAFFALSRDWVVTYMNGQAEQVFDKPRSELVGKHLWSVYPDAVDREFGQAYRRALQEQTTVRFEHYDPLRSCWYEFRAYPNDDGLGVFVTNIQEFKVAEEERERLARETMLYSAAVRRNQELHDLARRLVEIQEAERGHLAHELHEEIGQVLAGLKLSLAGILKQHDEARENQILMSQEIVTQLMRQVRALSLDLRPGVLDDLGLLPAVEWYCKRYTEQTEITVDLTTTGMDARLDSAVETTAYRIVQEALANAAHNSDVKAVEVRLVLQKEHLILQITGRGKGLALDSANCFCDHSGLTGMQERATLIGGTFETTTEFGQEGMIVARLPIHPIYTSLDS